MRFFIILNRLVFKEDKSSYLFRLSDTFSLQSYSMEMSGHNVNAFVSFFFTNGSISCFKFRIVFNIFSVQHISFKTENFHKEMFLSKLNDLDKLFSRVYEHCNVFPFFTSYTYLLARQAVWQRILHRKIVH